MTDIKIKKQRYADKENLKKLMRYSKAIFVNKSNINEKFWYSAYPDGAEAHNAMWGGREIGRASCRERV